MIWKGFRFGLLLQIAVGPICIFIFQTAAASGFWAAEIGVLGAVLVDIFFILAAIFGIGALLNKHRKGKKMIGYIGAGVLIFFGLSNIVGFFEVSPMPSLNFLSDPNTNSVFWKTLILTLSNPLTILFWAGVFSTKIAEEDLKQKDLYLFGFGAILSTYLFLTFISIVGSFLSLFLEPIVLSILNLLVGIILIGFGVRTFVKKA